MKDTMKTIKSLVELDLLLKGVSEVIESEAKEIKRCASWYPIR